MVKTLRFVKARFLPFISHVGNLQTSIVEGDDIYLEHTIAEVVRGNNVTIGPGCEISVVEYHTSFNQRVMQSLKNINKYK